MPSFDVVSQVNEQEVKNAVEQTNKEITNRYDFKGSDARVEMTELDLTVFADDEFKLGQVMDVLRQRLAKRSIDVRCLELGSIEKISGDKVSLLGQVELKGDWQAGVLVGQGQTDRYLTIFFLAQRRTVLSGDANRVPAGLGDAGVVEDPGLDRTGLLERRQSAPADDVEHRLIVPRRLGDEVVQRLVGCLDMQRIEPGGHRLDAFAPTRQQQTGAVAAQRADPVSVADHLRHFSDIGLEPDLTAGIGRNRRTFDHALLHGHRPDFFDLFYDTVLI